MCHEKRELYRVGDKVMLSDEACNSLKKTYGDLNPTGRYQIIDIINRDGNNGYYVRLPSKIAKGIGKVKYDCFLWEKDILMPASV